MAKKRDDGSNPKKNAKKGAPKKPSKKPKAQNYKTGLPAVIKPKVGRPSDYRDEYAEQAYKLCLLLDAEDEDLAKYFDKSRSTINLWKKEHPEFSDAIDAGKMKADANVAEKLYQRTQGCILKRDVPTKVKREFYVDGKKHTEEDVIVTTVEEMILPDVRAQEIWLHNRTHLKWKNRMAQAEKDAPPVRVTIIDNV